MFINIRPIEDGYWLVYSCSYYGELILDVYIVEDTLAEARATKKRLLGIK